jgi:hypothetical protein
MNIKESIDFLESHIDFEYGQYQQAWQTLKTAVLAQQTTKKQSTPLYITWNYCPDCGKRLSSQQYCDHK